MSNQNSIAVSKRVELPNGRSENKFEKFLVFTSFALVDFGIDIPHEEKIEELTEGDLKAQYTRYVYQNEAIQFVMDCVSQRVENIARSKDKAGGAIAESVLALLESGGGSKYPVILKQTREALVAWMQASTKLTDAQQAQVLKYTDTKALAIAKQKIKDQIGKVLAKFVDSLSDDSKSEFAMVINKLSDALEVSEDDLDFSDAI